MFDFEYVKDIFKKNIIAIASITFGVVSIVGSAIIVFNKDSDCTKVDGDAKIAYSEPADKSEDAKIKEPEKIVKVDIKGAVKKPGVYELSESATVDEAIKLAGGVTSKGVTSNINLSRKVKDEMVIYVFTKSELDKKQSANEIVCEIPKCDCETITVEECVDNGKTSNDKTVSDGTKKVSINTGSLEELMRLNGVGEAKAKAIIEYRNAHGQFGKLEDITNVPGIGSSVYENIKNDITL